MALVDQVEQAAGRGDEDVDAARQRLDLCALADAAEDDGVAQRQVAAVGLEAVGDLDGELAGRREDQRAGAPWRPCGRCGQCCSIGRAKAAVLPVPVWAMPSRSRPCEQRRDGLGLDRRGVL